MENENKDSDSELNYDTDLSSSHSSASDVTYVYENLVDKLCDRSRDSICSSENVSVFSDGTYVYNLRSIETSIEKMNLTSSIETSFDADSIESSSLPGDITDYHRLF